jgi:hypothetical protein
MRATDGSKPHYRAYCDKHSPAQAERDEVKGVPPAVVGVEDIDIAHCYS